jgi:hypothetical protein
LLGSAAISECGCFPVSFTCLLANTVLYQLCWHTPSNRPQISHSHHLNWMLPISGPGKESRPCWHVRWSLHCVTVCLTYFSPTSCPTFKQTMLLSY